MTNTNYFLDTILPSFRKGVHCALADDGCDASEVYDSALSWVLCDIGVGREYLDNAIAEFCAIVGYPSSWEKLGL